MSLADCPSNLKEAIDWILRVTGKDGRGGNGTDAIQSLTEKVKKLLQEIKGVDSGLGHQEFQKVISALGTHPNGLVAKLAEGLQQFIGYQSGGSNPHGKITGAGIAPSNIATHRLCDAAIAFTIGVLEGCKKHSAIKSNGSREKVNTLITKLHEQCGTGVAQLQSVSHDIKNDLNKTTFEGSSGFGLGEFLESLGNAFDSLASQVKNVQENVVTVAEKVGEYLKTVFAGSNSNWGGKADTAATKLQALVQNFNSDNTYSPSDSSFSNNISLVQSALNVGNHNIGRPILEAGKKVFLAVLRNDNYTSYYKETDTTSIDTPTCAKIFLSCIPLYYQALTYLYWRCHENGGGWKEMKIGGGSNGWDLKYFMFAMNYEAGYLNYRRGSDVVAGAIKAFEDFSAAMTEAQSKAGQRASAVTKARQTLSTGATADSNQKPTYPEFLAELQKKFTETLSQPTKNGNSLAALHHIATLYFKCQQSKNVTKAVKTPTTIREMLYYLAALPFSPNYDNFNTYVTDHFKKLSKSKSISDHDAALMIPVADSGISSKHNTLSAADIKDHLTSTCMYSMAALGWLQGPGASQNIGEPWLYELFCNTQFNLSYSSGPAIFNVLANCTYALQFQLRFLYLQCYSTYSRGCGWYDCRFGRDVNASGTSSLKSHICPGFKCKSGGCDHKRGAGSNNCNHNKYTETNSCGKSDKTPSPLQAFITGTLPSFNLSTSTNPNHLSDHRQGALCHVPMGFQATHLRHKAANGARVYLVLKAICGTSSSPLRQLSEKLGCLTKRTPRSLGDIFGFLWHLNYQLFNKDNIVEQLKTAITRRPNSVEEFITTFISLNQVPPQPSPADSGLVKSLQTMAPVIPFLYQLFRVNTDDFLPVTLFNLAQHCHKVENSNGSFKIMHENSSNSAVTSGHNCSSYPNDLWSLCQPVVPAPTGEGMTDPQSACRNAQCGGYMVPLTHSAGATYAPVHASVYLSWLAYLTEDFYEWFQNLLDEFKKIDCNESGCGGQSKCFDEHKAGTHGTSDKCQCASVVQCGGTLPLLYRHGFQFYSPAVLMDGSNNNTKRDCKAFADQLQSVISGQSLSSLLTSIDAFLYAIRWEFFSKLSGFWTIYLTLILYTFFFLLDTLHLRSHLKLASSHTVPPLALLTTGKALPVTKLTYIVP